MAETDKAYIGIRPCGCITWAMVTGVAPKDDERREIQRAIKQDLAIEVLTVEEARKRPNFLVICKHGRQTIPTGQDLQREVATLMETKV